MSAPTERIRVLVADDEVLIRGAVEALLALEDDLEVLPGISDGIAAVAAAQEHRPDVCLLDLEMPGLDGVEAAQQILRSVPTKVVIFTRHARPGVLRRALAEQVSGFVPKSTPAEELAVVLRQVVAGRRYVDPEIAASALTAERSPLTDRELDVLRAGRDAARVEDIAAALHLAPGTVRNHVSNAIGKLGVRTRQEAERAAWEAGWI
ncbi:DNA-binding response regulator [Micrococcus sp. HSID17228]|uniref:response regulator transcription factor n=1 Tax=Micrococcus TaxID=1269 RepID=UPI000FAC60C6|nr:MULTISPECIES: response regulator transcription factor [Micrococcus]MCT1816306.1 response regulator transcription factor [Micrococcus luteus]MCV7495202.1 response regulator transcription factor [Micrococcus luteus]MCV7539283.1 response regulator transcription factor [Micrococcus luteus]MCV7642041.1 response regulator transcription factor [Micrococcus luteus]QGY90887.1 response regulator transcription factor [Micrococcus luteus]